MSMLLPIALALVAAGDPPMTETSHDAVSPLQIVAALESVLGDVIAAVEPSVVAISREKSENDETLAVRGRDTSPAPAPNRRVIGGLITNVDPLGGLIANVDPFGSDNLSFDYGSGVVIGDQGEILTAFHVVRGAKALYVRAANRQAFIAEVIAADPRSDLAVIAPKNVAGRPAPKLKPLPVGNAAKLRKGSFLVALGNPFNAARDGRPSASWGILSNVARRLDQTSEELGRGVEQLRHYPTLLQLDAKLNLGMSGGAVVNLKGELVGLTTSAANAGGFDAQAGYAIPMDKVGRNVLEALKQGKEYEYGFLGIGLDKEFRTNQVRSAEPGTPAGLGGVLVNDAIVAVGDQPVTDADSLVVAINSIPAGEPVTLKLLRKDVLIERKVVLAKLKLRGARAIATNRPEPWRGLRVDYTSTLGSTSFPHDLFEAMAREGVAIVEVEPGSTSARAGLKPGQIISRIDGHPVRNPRDFARVVKDLKGPVKVETEQGLVEIK